MGKRIQRMKWRIARWCADNEAFTPMIAGVVLMFLVALLSCLLNF